MARSHGMSRTPTWWSWVSMRKRCTNKSDNRYNYYGGRGIKVCDRWLESFENFYEDMGERPDGMTLDRIDNDGDYEPDNCRWATQELQTRNRGSFNRQITINGESKCLQEWCETFDLKRELVRDRLDKLGWTTEEAFGLVERKGSPVKRVLSHEGQSKTLKDWCDTLCIPYNTAYSRLRRGLSVEEILNIGVNYDETK